MKKNMILVLIALLIFASVPLFSSPSDEEAVQAFSLSFQVYITSSLLAAFGQSSPGVSITETCMTFSNVDLSSMSVDGLGSYKTLSGKINVINENNITADLKLSGGAVKNLSWSIDGFDAQNENNVVKIKADGKSLTFDTSKM